MADYLKGQSPVVFMTASESSCICPNLQQQQWVDMFNGAVEIELNYIGWNQSCGSGSGLTRSGKSEFANRIKILPLNKADFLIYYVL